MKKIHVSLLVLGTVMVASLIPVESSKAYNPLSTECFHMADGVLDPYPYYSFSGPGSCPDFSASNDTSSSDKHAPNLEPHQCEEIGITEDYQ